MTRALYAVVWSVLLASHVSAQEIASSFGEMSGRVRLGETLFITDTKGTTIEGKLSGMTGPVLDVRPGRNRDAPPLRLSESDVNNIVVIRRDRLWNGPLFGFAAGAGTAAMIELINSRGSQKFQGGSVVALGNLSAIIGLVVDLFNREKVTVYVQKPRH